MSYPILYSATETEFEHNGLGILGDCAMCEVEEEGNGSFELSMQYPMDGIHFEDIKDRSIIKAKADQFRTPQLFRVYSISKPMSGIVTILAEHISYDLSGIPVSGFSAENVVSALAGLKSNAVTDCPFTFWTDKNTAAKFSHVVPASIRSKLGCSAGSILDVYGGELEFDNYTVKLHNNRGMNRGVSIRYGKNLTDIKQDQNCSNVVTGIYPYWYLETDVGNVLIELPEKIVNVPGTHNFSKIKAVDFTQYFELQPTYDELRQAAKNYIASNNVGVPKVSMKISFAQLEQSEEYRHLKLLERVALFDTVNVEFPALGVSATAKAVKLVYDVLADRVKSVTLGSVRANIADTIAKQQQEIQKVPTKTELEKVKEAATAWLTNGKGYAYFRKDDFGNIIDILFMDTQDVETAVNVMRVGQSGIGFSHNGVNGQYNSAWTIDGTFNADFIATGKLYGLLIEAGLIQSADGKISIDLSSNADFATFNSGISTNGLVVRADETDAKKLFSVDAYKVPGEEDEYFVNVSMQSASGSEIMRITETFEPETKTPVGCSFSIKNQSGDAAVSMSTGLGSGYLVVKGGGSGYASLQSRNLGSSGLGLFEGDTAVGGFVQENGESKLATMYLNGKKVDWKQNDSGDYVLTGV